MSSTLRPYLTTGLTLVGAGLLAATPVSPPASDAQPTRTRLLSNDTYVVDSPNHLAGLIVGGSGTPIPQLNGDWVNQYNDLFVQRILPGANSEGVFTPEGAEPIFSGIKSLPLNTSIAQDQYMLDTYVTQNVAAGNTVAVAVHSQSSMVASQLMTELQQQGVPADAVRFVLTGDPDNPDGGLFNRMTGSVPAFGFDFGTATPSDTIYQTSIYTLEYDGFADFPKYPLNILADLNAELGEGFIHPLYRTLTPTDIDDAIKLPTSADYDGVTNYYLIPMADDQIVPLLRPLEFLPFIGKPLAALLNPDLEQLINLGYDNPDNQGWDVGPADVSTQFGLLPSTDQIMTALKNLGPGLQQGMTAAVQEIKDELTAAAAPAAHPDVDPGSAVPDAFTSPTAFLNDVTGALDQLGSLGLPAWDSLISAAITLPQNAITTLVGNLDDPLNAIGLAAGQTAALTTQLGVLDLLTVVETVNPILAELGLSGIPLEVLTP